MWFIIYLIFTGRHVVYLTDLEGRLRRVVGDKQFCKSDEEGKFNKPGCITVDSKGNFLVADTGNNRVQAFTSEGVFLSVVEIGFVRKPGGLQLDDNGRLFMVSTQDQEVYAMKLSHQSENHQYERPMSQGSRNFFRIREDHSGGGGGSEYNDRRGGRRKRGAGRRGGNSSNFGESGNNYTTRGGGTFYYGRGRGHTSHAHKSDTSSG